MFANGKALSEHRRFRQVLGRVAVVTTVWEGFCDIGSMLSLLWLQRRRWMEANGNERKNERKRGAVANWLL